MTPISYIYSTLKYEHSQVLGEVLNVGILVYVPGIKQLQFVYPEKLARLRFAYPNVSERTLKGYLKSFSEKISLLNQKAELFADYQLEESLDKFIEIELLPKDSSSLQFSKSKKGITYTKDLNQIIKHLYSFYLLAFNSDEHGNSQIDETTLLTKYKNLLKELSTNVIEIKDNRNFFIDYTVNLSEEKKFKFDVAWKNDSLNLVRPISFDLVKPEAILNKAYRFFGQFIDLETIADNNNYRFDLIIANPQKPELSKAFDSAVDLLKKPSHVKLIFEKELPDYTQKTLEAINQPD